jgi:membrane-bound serine protease (ClpP class)
MIYNLRVAFNLLSGDLEKTMKIIRLLLLFLFLLAPTSTARAGTATVLRFSGVINPASAEYLGGSIAKISAEKSADLVVVMLDTPGGLDTSMRIIVKEIMASRVPVCVYVAPSGSRAASAGTFIGMAAHIFAMAPGTSTGSAHPVAMGQKMDETMSKKAENDAAAYIKSLALERGRNSEWAENAVRQSVSLGEQDALKKNVVDYVARDLDDLFRQMNGRKVKVGGVERTIDAKSITVTHKEMTRRQKALDAMSDPTIAYILLMLGFYGLFFELSNPGVILPGVIGGICLVLGFYSMQSLPINYAALLLLLLGVVMFVSELYVTSHGALTVGGITSVLLGAVLFMESSPDYMKVNLWVVLPVAGTLGALFLAMLGYGVFYRSKKVPTGAEGLPGLEGKTLSEVGDAGTVEVEGERWGARSETGVIAKGAPVSVVRKDGPILVVKPRGG